MAPDAQRHGDGTFFLSAAKFGGSPPILAPTLLWTWAVIRGTWAHRAR